VAVLIEPWIGLHLHLRLQPLYADAIRALALERNKTVSHYLREDVVGPFFQAKVKERTVLQFAATVSQLNRHEREYIALAYLVRLRKVAGTAGKGVYGSNTEFKPP
jgi:hypothetical protein